MDTPKIIVTIFSRYYWMLVLGLAALWALPLPGCSVRDERFFREVLF